MARRTRPTPITPEIQSVIDGWYTFAAKNDMLVANAMTDIAFKAKVMLDSQGACPCKPKERLACPCAECLTEVKADGWCFCRVFAARDWEQKWQKHMQELTMRNSS